MTDAGRPLALLHTGDPALLPRLHVLADRLADMPDAPRLIVTGPRDGPVGDTAECAAFLDRHPVDLIVLCGDLLPGALIDLARQRGIALMLIEAGTPVPQGRRRLIPGATRALLNGFVGIHTRDAASCGALRRMLRSEVRVHDTGELARYLPAPGCNIHELEALRQALGARPAWFAHDLPPAEAEAILLAHAHALRRAHRLLLIAQPRDPAQSEALATRARDVGFACARRQLDEEITETTQVYIADAGDDPGLFLRLAPVTYLGGSLSSGLATPPGLLPASLGSALLLGPYAGPDQAVFLDLLVRRGGARRVGVAPALGEALTALLSPETGADAALRAWQLASEGSTATESVAQAIADWARRRREGA